MYNRNFVAGKTETIIFSLPGGWQVMDLQKLYSLTRQAVSKLNMISAGDRVAVGLSGGKDSVAMLYALAGLSRFYPEHFEVAAITVDLGLGMDFSPMKNLCNELGVEYHIVDTDIFDIVNKEKKETNPCSLCAKLRKGALNKKAIEIGCNTVAYAHHRDDFVNTFFMSLLLEGRIHSLSPVFILEKTGLKLIRPLCMVSEADIKGFNNKMKLDTVNNLCPVDGNSKRTEVDEMISALSKRYPDIRQKVFGAIERSGFYE